jgi:UDP-N-acetylglucosamine diphosphorylase/glucosamine-1-phosphate N-acetyltransferase
MNTVIILAGGLGKRMNSDLPKVLHRISGVPMLIRVIWEADPIANRILIVVGKYRELIETVINESSNIPYEKIEYVNQPIPKGTGHAVMCCLPYLKQNQPVLILSGDVPLIKTDTMNMMMGGLNDFCVMAATVENPTGYGRLLQDSEKRYFIVEEKDCSDRERECKLVNCGIYSTYGRILIQYLPFLTTNNSQGEYYLTDIVKILRTHGVTAQICEIGEEKKHEVMGVNTEEDLNVVAKFCNSETDDAPF